MKRIANVLVSTALVVLPLYSVQASASPKGVPSWLQGCWEFDGPKRTLVERWTPADTGVLLGVGFTRSGEVVRHQEFLTIAALPSGTTVYIAQPRGQATTQFHQVERGSASITWSNPAHDFPQWIRYTRDGDRLQASIGTLPLTAAPAASWTMARTHCAGTE